jgi:hypothetical protein
VHNVGLSPHSYHPTVLLLLFSTETSYETSSVSVSSLSYPPATAGRLSRVSRLQTVYRRHMSNSDDQPPQSPPASPHSVHLGGREQFPSHQASTGAGSNVLNYSPAAMIHSPSSPSLNQAAQGTPRTVSLKDKAEKDPQPIDIPDHVPPSTVEPLLSPSMLSEASSTATTHPSTPQQSNGGFDWSQDKQVHREQAEDVKPVTPITSSPAVPAHAPPGPVAAQRVGEQQPEGQRPSTAPTTRPPQQRKPSLAKPHPADRPTSPGAPKQSVFGKLFGDKDKDRDAQRQPPRPASAGGGGGEPGDRSDGGDSSDGGIAGGFAAFARRTSAGIAGRREKDREAVKASNKISKASGSGKNADVHVADYAAASPGKKDGNWSESDTEREQLRERAPSMSRQPSGSERRTDGERASSWRELVEKQATKLKRGSSVGSRKGEDGNKSEENFETSSKKSQTGGCVKSWTLVLWWTFC